MAALILIALEFYTGMIKKLWDEFISILCKHEWDWVYEDDGPWRHFYGKCKYCIMEDVFTIRERY